MAEIRLCAEAVYQGGPSLPCELHARIVFRPWPDGGTVPTLEISTGNDTVSIWPADPDYIDKLGDKLKSIAETLRIRERSKE